MEKGKMEIIIPNNDPFIQRSHKSPRLPSRTLFSFRENISLKRTNVTNNKHDKKHDEMEEERGGGELTYPWQHTRAIIGDTTTSSTSSR